MSDHAQAVAEILAQYRDGHQVTYSVTLPRLSSGVQQYICPAVLPRGRNPRWYAAWHAARALYVSAVPIHAVNPLDQDLSVYCRVRDELIKRPGMQVIDLAVELDISAGVLLSTLRRCGSNLAKIKQALRQ